MSIFYDISQLLDVIETAFTRIKISANAKGAGILDSDGITVWAARIDTLDTTPPYLDSDPAGNVLTFCPRTKMVLPTTDRNGNPLSTTLIIDKIIAAEFYCIEDITIPAYFQDVKIICDAYVSNVEEPQTTKRLEILAPSVELGDDMFSPLEYLSIPNCTNLGGNWQSMRLGYYSEKLQINVPKLLFWFASFKRSTNAAIDITGSDFSSLEEWGARANGGYDDTSLGYRVCGTVHFPNLKKLNWVQPPYASEISHFYLPALETLPYQNALGASRATGANGVNHLYIGRNLNTVAPANNLRARVNDGSIVLHIPAGESTTKNTLDGLNISYNQDYEM